ncbi:methanol/ethanol family PQQ-dependent dehydrogenase [Mesorhizobium loti]|uniref:methanol/ethanol family PQQ-dependent dehydrogenase n=1 Tax=Mesorhizobium TaxID=68287 RepID=UPI0007EC7434|nr:methanol/ethanol family PQQ-dependent dehydrogenase [Mesorhizobium loti]
MATIDGRTKMRVIGWTLLAGLATVAGAVAQPAEPAIKPPAAAAPPDDGQWTMPAKNYASTRYSELAEITEDNVKTLQVAFTFSTGVNKGQEAAPLVVGDTMYIVTPFPNILYALDLTKPGAPMKWKFEPNPEPAAQGVACCDVVNRGAAFSNGRLYFNTLDGHTIAVDATTGKPVWNTHIGNINIGETITMAPLVVKGMVLVGNSGGEMGVRGWIKALDAGDGHVIWTAYSTGPDAEVLIGPDFKPHYNMDKGKDLGVTSWPPDAWKIGGGNVWGWISYDPDLDLIFHGTGNPGPWNPDLRPGDNKWTSGIFARDPDTGTAKWFYQWTPHDLHDYDGINEQVLLDMTWQGKPRKVLVRPERNGYVYLLDRMTGEVLSAVPFGPVNSSKGVDLKTGRLIVNPEKETGTGKVVRNICPTASGLKDWQPSAFSPKTGLLYIPHNNLCMDEEGVEVNYIAGTPYVGMNVRMIPGPGGHRGAFTAWDVAAAKPAWILKENFPVWSGAVVTAGNVVFYGTMEGWFKAVSATTGKLLWQFKTSSGIIGQPITYRGPDGRQYVAILSGVGGWAGAIVSGDLDPRDATAALGFANVMKDLKDVTTPGGTLYVFRLP